MRNVMKTATLEANSRCSRWSTGASSARTRTLPWPTGWSCPNFHAHEGGIRGRPFDLGESGQGTAELQHRAQAGLLHRGKLPSRHLQGRPEFLSRSFERHFNERPYLQHTCYLFLTKTTKERSRTTSSFNALTRNFIIPKEMTDRETVTRFMESCEQFERIVNDSGLLRMTRLTDEEITGTDTSAGIIEKYFSLAGGYRLFAGPVTRCREMKIGDNYLCLHTLSDPEDLPSNVATDCRYERLSTDRSDCRLSFAAPIGILLTCNHVVNQYLFIDDSAESLRKFEQTARNMHSLSRYSRSNQINREWIEEYLNEAHSKG